MIDFKIKNRLILYNHKKNMYWSWF